MRLALVALAAVLAAPAVHAEEAPAASGDFSLAPAEGRQLKIDRRTGEVSVCAETDGRWSCRLVPDERSGYEAEIARLEAERKALEARLAAIEARVGRLETDANWIGPDDEEKLDRFFDFTDKAFRRFFGMVEDLKQDLDPPDRT